ncbi:IroE protein [Bacillus sp. J14TS2]|uniref:alpha/beta hydrolase n=1 Tax=Bacillus sp. J14TS2 TaxID=2807188 RepID=UPI001B23A2FA|nr:alpha/beta hydrolase-fold protein [Bacillus sp. J14TS2]GIN73661.1 IroE protein [Bacillus sp. J14TS2]
MKKITLENTYEWEIHSEFMNLPYDIKVAIPSTPPPQAGYPIIYVLDGNAYFSFARDVIRLQSKRAAKTFIDSAIVVGIGHPGDDEAVSKRRFYEFTAPAEAYIYPERLKRFGKKEHGGAERLMKFIQFELKPEIEKHFSVDQQKQALFGHSLSGLFTLWALFTQPKAFQTYLVISPSIWWNDHELYHYANEFLQKTDKQSDVKLFIAVGEHEAFMVNDAKQLFSQLERDFNCSLYIAPEENHASVVPTTISRAFRFAYTR